MESLFHFITLQIIIINILQCFTNIHNYIVTEFQNNKKNTNIPAAAFL